MVSTHFDVSQLPSLKDGISAEEEALKRRKTCRFIEEAGRVLKLPRVAVSTAMVFFHRFYAKHSFNDHDRFEVAVAAIVLAAKTEESPKKLKDVIMECHKLKSRGMQAGRIAAQQAQLKESLGGRSPPPPPPLPIEDLNPKEEEFAKLKERILLLERVILHTIGFELSIDHPYKFFVEQIKRLIHNRQLRYKALPTGGPPDKTTNTKLMNEMVQNSMSLANDSMHTSLCLQFTPQAIATAVVYLAAQFAKVEPSQSYNAITSREANWPTLLGNPDVETFASICIQIMELISDKNSSKSDQTANQIKKIRAQLELLKSRSNAAAVAGAANEETSNLLTKRSPLPTPPGGEPSSKRQKI